MDRITVREAVFDFLRRAGVDTVFGNPGSTELRMLRDWPAGLRYVLGLQESVVVAMELQSLECACAHHNLFLMETLS